MPKQRAIDLSLIREIDPKSSGAKGKMTIINLFKETLDGLNVPYGDTCCNEIPQIDQIFPEIFSLPSNFQTQSILPYTVFNDAVGTTVTAVGPYDKVVIASSPMNPNAIGGVTFFRLLSEVNSSNCKELSLRVRVNSLGVTNPMIGIGLANVTTTGDIDGKPRACMVDFKNALLGASDGITSIVRYPTSVAPTIDAEVNLQKWENITQKRGAIGVANTYVNAGNIVNVKWQIDARNLTERFTFINENTGAYVEATSNLGFGPRRTPRCTFGYAQALSIALSDGDYTILDFNVKHLAKRGIKILIAGDSMGRGDRIYAEESLSYKLDKMYPNNTSSTAAAGSQIYNIQKTQIPDIIRLQPKYTFLFHYIQIIDQRFMPAHADYLNYIDAFTKVVNGIIGIKSIPVLIKPPFWPWPGVTQTFMDNWYNFVDQQVPLFPQALVLDLRDLVLTYDNTSFPHYSGDSNELIAREIAKLIDANE